jgi:hypothetical protein
LAIIVGLSCCTSPNVTTVPQLNTASKIRKQMFFFKSNRTSNGPCSLGFNPYRILLLLQCFWCTFYVLLFISNTSSLINKKIVSSSYYHRNYIDTVPKRKEKTRNIYSSLAFPEGITIVTSYDPTK